MKSVAIIINDLYIMLMINIWKDINNQHMLLTINASSPPSHSHASCAKSRLARTISLILCWSPCVRATSHSLAPNPCKTISAENVSKRFSIGLSWGEQTRTLSVVSKLGILLYYRMLRRNIPKPSPGGGRSGAKADERTGLGDAVRGN